MASSDGKGNDNENIDDNLDVDDSENGKGNEDVDDDNGDVDVGKKCVDDNEDENQTTLCLLC